MRKRQVAGVRRTRKRRLVKGMAVTGSDASVRVALAGRVSAPRCLKTAGHRIARDRFEGSHDAGSCLAFLVRVPEHSRPVALSRF